MAEIVQVNPDAPEPHTIARAAELIRQGQAVAIAGELTDSARNG